MYNVYKVGDSYSYADSNFPIPSWVREYYTIEELPEGTGNLKRDDTTGSFYFDGEDPGFIETPDDIPEEPNEPDEETADVYDELASAYREGVDRA